MEAKERTDNKRRRKQRRGQTTKEEGSKGEDKQEGADVKKKRLRRVKDSVDYLKDFEKA